MNTRAARDRELLKPLAAGAVEIGGRVGALIDACIDNRVLAQPVEPLVEHFQQRSDGPEGFRGEFWGKWFTSLVLAWQHRPSEAIAAKMRRAVELILATQTPDGCISTYPYPEQHGMWDAWSRKYVLLGLANYAEAMGGAGGDGDPEGLGQKVLDAACRMLEHFMTQAGSGKISLADCGHWAWKGLPPSSILEPVAILHRLTGRADFDRFARWIIACWSKPSKYLEKGLRLVEDALAGQPARLVGNPKAYEQMSCFEGLCEMHLACGEPRWLDAAVALAMSIRETELTVVGSGSNQEMWSQGARDQTEILEQPQETCATVTWMKLCYRLLKLTGNPLWADELEKSLYNALPAAMKADGSWWTYYTPLQGERVASHYQYADVGLSCCVASGPRALLLTGRWAVMCEGRAVAVNLYAPIRARVTLDDGTPVQLVQRTDYPRGGEVEIAVHLPAGVEKRFELKLRIPAWSRRTSCVVDGQRYTAEPGGYLSLDRVWREGDAVTLCLDMRTRAVAAPSGAPHLALVRGPVALALDSRLVAPQRKTLRLVVGEDGCVDARAVEPGDADIQMAFEIPCVYHQVHIVETAETLRFCDFASAGNRWSAENLYRVWMPQPLFMAHAFTPDTWKITYPESPERPESPTCRNDF